MCIDLIYICLWASYLLDLTIPCTEGHKVGRMNTVLNHTFQHHIKMNKSHQTTSRPKVLSFLTNLLATESSCPQPKIWKQCYGNVPAIAESLAAEGGEHHPSAFALHTVVFCTKVISSLKIKFKKGERKKKWLSSVKGRALFWQKLCHADKSQKQNWPERGKVSEDFRQLLSLLHEDGGQMFSEAMATVNVVNTQLLQQVKGTNYVTTG